MPRQLFQVFAYFFQREIDVSHYKLYERSHVFVIWIYKDMEFEGTGSASEPEQLREVLIF